MPCIVVRASYIGITMWFYVLTLIVFGHLQIGVKSLPLAGVAVEAFEYVPGTGNVQIHHQVTTWDTAGTPHKVNAAALAVAISGERVLQVRPPSVASEHEPVFTRQRRQSAAAAASSGSGGAAAAAASGSAAAAAAAASG